METAINYLVVGITSIVFLIILDLISAVAVHIKTKTFDWKKVAEFLRTNVVPYVLIWGTLGAVPVLLSYVEVSGDVILPLEGAVGFVWLIIIGKLFKSIWDNFKTLGIEFKK